MKEKVSELIVIIIGNLLIEINRNQDEDEATVINKLLFLIVDLLFSC